ncbi:uncharacterized protein CEXT_139841 [Caerostris extrusa]|uniref:Uncharacterized protein n=1 Tax=Caerostris extrusa TaxID=172846 RepID=A0AAV4TI11_CAEEX|nr:uncharacterized protein CEXT_139841 [Caerostris extrusa]
MKLELVLAFLWSMVLLTCTKEVPLDEQNESNKSDTTTDSADIDWDAFKDSRDSTNENPSIKDNTAGRWNHSRMLLRSSTTLDYDEWWFFTTRRPILSHKDYPGSLEWLHGKKYLQALLRIGKPKYSKSNCCRSIKSVLGAVTRLSYDILHHSCCIIFLFRIST